MRGCWCRKRRASCWCRRAAIQRNATSTYVYLVKPDSTVTVRHITTGTTEGDETEITSGLDAGRRRGDDRRRQIAGRQQGERAGSGRRRAREVRAAADGRRQSTGRQDLPIAANGKAHVSPSRTFILRPVATSLLMVGILLAGAVAYKQLPVSALPEVDYPTIQVITFYPGASPDVMASSVTAPLERQFGQVPGLQQMTSTSSDGSSVITLQFNLSLNIDVAEQEVQQSINASGTYLAGRSADAADLQQDQSRPTRRS